MPESLAAITCRFFLQPMMRVHTDGNVYLPKSNAFGPLEKLVRCSSPAPAVWVALEQARVRCRISRLCRE